MPNLYELSADYRDALKELIDLEDEAVVDTLDALKGELQIKAVNVAKYAENLKAAAKAIKEAEARMKQRRTAIENRAKHLTIYLKNNMEAAKIMRIETPEFVLSIQKNPPAVEIYDEENIPAEFRREKIIKSIDKPKLKAALAVGSVPGANLVRGTRLVIK